MEGLNAKDIEILGFYARAGNRELYFNYLAHKAGNDGYYWNSSSASRCWQQKRWHR